MVKYTFDEALISIMETKNEIDISVTVTFKHPEMVERIKQLRSLFDQDREYTDVMFFAHHDGSYEIIVRLDHYDTLFIEMFRFRLITSLRWV